MTPRIKLIVKPQHSWDDWVSQDRLRKLTDENKELASNLKKDMDALRNRNAKPSVSHKKKIPGTDSSARGSEERHSSAAAGVPPRGQKRNRDWETEKVCFYSMPLDSPVESVMRSLLHSEFATSQDEWSQIVCVAIVPSPIIYILHKIPSLRRPTNSFPVLSIGNHSSLQFSSYHCCYESSAPFRFCSQSTTGGHVSYAPICPHPRAR